MRVEAEVAIRFGEFQKQNLQIYSNFAAWQLLTNLCMYIDTICVCVCLPVDIAYARAPYAEVIL